MRTSYTSNKTHPANDGGLRAYLVALGGGPDDYDADVSDVIAQQPYVLRFAYDDPPESSDDDDDWEGEDEIDGDGWDGEFDDEEHHHEPVR